MSLVNYSDSSSSDSDSDNKVKKIKLELPNVFKTQREDQHENPELHQGRTRAIPHERGNWISYFYINYPLIDSIQNLQDAIIQYSSTNLNLELHKMEDIHLSLSRVLNIRYHWIDDLFETVRKDCCQKPFELELNPILEVFVNDEKTRTFIGILTSEETNKTLNKLVGKIDQSLISYKLPTYYKPPIFHISFLWTLGDQSKIFTEEILDKLNELLQNQFADDDNDFRTVVENILFKSGYKIFNVRLS